MHATLVGKGVLAHIGRAWPGGLVEDLIHPVGYLGQFFQLTRAKKGSCCLQRQVRDEGGQIGVTHPFAIAIDATLDLDSSRPDAAMLLATARSLVVMAMDAQVGASGNLWPTRVTTASISSGRDTAVGVAQDQTIRSRLDQAASRHFKVIFGIDFVAVKKMLGIVENLIHLRLEELHGVVDDFEVLFKGYSQGFGHMEIPGLPHHRDGGVPA